MNLQDKIRFLYGRHIKLTVEWGGNEYAASCSDLDEDLAVKLLLGVKKEVGDFPSLVDEVISEQYERERP